MAFGAQDMQSAERDDFVMFGFALLCELFEDGLPLFDGNLKNFAFVLEQNHRHGRGRRIAIGTLRLRGNHGRSLRVRHGKTILQKILARHRFRITAQQNIGSAASHVGGNSDGAFSPRLRHDV